MSQKVKGWAIILMLLLAIGFVFSQGGSKPKAEPVKVEAELTAQDLENKRKAKEQYEAERARSRQMEAERKRQQEQEQIAREAERAANRMAVEDFDWQFMENVNVLGLNHVDHMGTPKRGVEGVNETLTYPLDLDGDLSITEITKGGKIKGARITVHHINQGSLGAAVVFYNALVQVFTTSGEANSIFYGLHLDETFFDDVKNTRTVNHNGYRYTKALSDKKLILAVVEQ